VDNARILSVVDVSVYDKLDIVAPDISLICYNITFY
jgi:hypothetical protein